MAALILHDEADQVSCACVSGVFGQVLIDGTDVRDYDLPAYRQQLGVVPQEPYLFAGTVRDAIAYGRPAATDAEVEAAARGVGAI